VPKRYLEVIEKCREAIKNGVRVIDPHRSEEAAPETLKAVTVRPSEAPEPTVHVTVPAARPQAAYAPFQDVLSGLSVKRGKRLVFELLHAFAVVTAQARGYGVCPDAVTFHLPQGLVAAVVGYSDRQVRRVVGQLKAAGLIDCGAHASLVNDMRLWDGYLWSVKVKPSAAKPSLRREEWRHHWRDFAGDMASGRTVKALLEQVSGLQAEERKDALEEALEAWAVSRLNTIHPVVVRSDTSEDRGVEALQDVREVAYRLGELAHVPASKQAEWVGRTASVLARLLNDLRSRRWYCRLLWDALEAEWEGRSGLGTLSAALTRLEADRTEWPGLRNPAALLVARLQIRE